MHLHTTAGIAVSCQAGGLLPLSQHSLLPVSTLSYHPYEGPIIQPEERQRLVQHLGANFALILQNHGLQTCAASVGEAFWLMYFLQRACEIQVLAQAGGALNQIALAPPGPLAETALKGARDDAVNRFWPAILRSMERLDPSYRD
jgi:ribulose-5-phosphate 4-epimerase/fuculose-1-phosphate aldolase